MPRPRSPASSSPNSLSFSGLMASSYSSIPVAMALANSRSMVLLRDLPLPQVAQLQITAAPMEFRTRRRGRGGK